MEDERKLAREPGHPGESWPWAPPRERVPPGPSVSVWRRPWCERAQTQPAEKPLTDCTGIINSKPFVLGAVCRADNELTQKNTAVQS